MRLVKNIPEQLLQLLADSNGWIPTKRGWPDFMCINSKSGEVIAIEVKPRLPSGRMRLLKREQATCMDFLSAHGIRCFVSDGVTLERYAREIHANEEQRRKSRVEMHQRIRLKSQTKA